MLINAPFNSVTHDVIGPAIEVHRVLGVSYRLDLVVEGMVVVEVKSVATLLPVHEAQLLTHLCLSATPAGLLINFNVPKLVDGVKRLINPKVANR